MGKRGRVTLIEVSPGFESIRTAVSQTLGKHSLTIVGSSSALLLRIQEAFVGDPVFADLRASGMVDLVTLSQVVSKFCTAAAIPTMPTMDLDRQAALIGLTARRLSDDSAFAGSKHLPGFYEAAAKTLQEMRRERVRIDSIGTPAGKLRDVALLQEGLRDELQRRSYCTLSEKIESLLGAPPTLPNEAKHVLWLPEREWPELYLQLLEWIVRAGVDLRLAAEVHPGNADFFAATEVLRKRFPDCDVVNIDADLKPGSKLFSDNELGSTGELTILEASDDFIEVEWAIKECRRRIRNDGIDASDIVIFARSLETYGPMLRAASDREGLPIAIDYAEPLKAHPFTRYVLRAMEAMLTSDVGAVVSLVRSAYGQIPREERRAHDKRIRELARESSFWNALGNASKAGELPEWLAAIANWRRIALDGQRKPSDWMRGIEQLMASTPWLQASSAREEAARDMMVRSLNIGLLTLDPYEGVTFGEFVEFASKTWSAADYRVRTQGGIRVVSDPAIIGAAKVVIGVGVVEGRFPSRRAEDPILLDRDRLALAQLDSGAKLADSYERAREDDRDFYRLLSSCSDLTLCFPATVGENPQERAAYLWELQTFPGVRTEKRGFSQRFPKPEECDTERDLVASILWHGDPGFPPMDSISNRIDSLTFAFRESQNSVLKDDILRAKLGLLPQPLRMSHLRSLGQCPFQYFARHKLGISSAKGDPMNRVIVNSIRRSNFNSNDLDEFRKSLLQGLESELESLKGVLSDHEMQVIRFSAPTTLDQFARMEMDARKQWKLKPYQVTPHDEQNGLRKNAKFGDTKIVLSPAVDILYKREETDELVPMRIGWETDENQAKLESYLVMLMHPGDSKYMMFDAYNHSRRTLYCRRTDDRKEKLAFRGNLAVDIGPKHLRELRNDIGKWMQEMLATAKSGNPIARPNSRHCPNCDLGSFCREAPYADPAVDWTATTEPEAGAEE